MKHGSLGKSEDMLGLSRIFVVEKSWHLFSEPCAELQRCPLVAASIGNLSNLIFRLKWLNLQPPHHSQDEFDENCKSGSYSDTGTSDYQD